MIDMKVVMIDDVATTGGSVVNAIKSLKEVNVVINDAYVIVNRMEGANEASKGIRSADAFNFKYFTNYRNIT